MLHYFHVSFIYVCTGLKYLTTFETCTVVLTAVTSVLDMNSSATVNLYTYLRYLLCHFLCRLMLSVCILFCVFHRLLDLLELLLT